MKVEIVKGAEHVNPHDPEWRRLSQMSVLSDSSLLNYDLSVKPRVHV